VVELNKTFGTKDIRREVSGIEGAVEGGLIKSVTTGDITALADAGKVAFDKLIALEEKTLSNVETITENAMNTALNDIMTIYKNQINTTQNQGKKEIDLNLNYNLKSDTPNITIQQLETMLKTFFDSTVGIKTLKDAVGSELLPQ
jgi:hypothetical protein